VLDSIKFVKTQIGKGEAPIFPSLIKIFHAKVLLASLVEEEIK
jgi:hypothetical protein